MSSIGTSVAAGVAQTAQQGQAVSRGRDRQATQATQQQDETNDKVDRLLKTGETADADEHLPDRPALGYEQLARSGVEAERDEGVEDGGDAAADGGGASDGPLYDHVDLRA
ncbi:MAG: hypothetical protein AAF078_02930 [Planctomycetota bacterium]